MLIFDCESGDYIQTLSDNMAMGSDGDFVMRLSDTMVMDMDSGDIHTVSSWPSADEDG